MSRKVSFYLKQRCQRSEVRRGKNSEVRQCRMALPRSDSRNSNRFALALQNSPISTRRGKAILNFRASQRGRLRRPPVSLVHQREVVLGRQRVQLLVPQDLPPLGEHLLLQRGCLHQPPPTSPEPSTSTQASTRGCAWSSACPGGCPQDLPLGEYLLRCGCLRHPPLSLVHFREIGLGR